MSSINNNNNNNVSGAALCRFHSSQAKKDPVVGGATTESCPVCLSIEARYDAMSWGTPTPLEDLSLLSDSASEAEGADEPFVGKMLAGLADHPYASLLVPHCASSPALSSLPTPAGAIQEELVLAAVQEDVKECSFSYGPFCLSPDTGRNSSFMGRELNQYVWPTYEWDTCSTVYSEGHTTEVAIRRRDKAEWEDMINGPRGQPWLITIRLEAEKAAAEAAAAAALQAQTEPAGTTEGADLQECSVSFSSFCVIGDADINASFCGMDFQGKLDCPCDLDVIPEFVEQPEPTIPSSEEATAPYKLLTVGAIINSTSTTAIKSGKSVLIVPSVGKKRFTPKTNPMAMPQHAKHTEDVSLSLAELSKESLLIEKDINVLFELGCAAPSTKGMPNAKSTTGEDVSLSLALLSYESMIMDATLGPLYDLACEARPVKTKLNGEKSSSKDDSLPLPDVSAESLLLANSISFRRELAAVGPSLDIKPLKAPKLVTKAVQTIKKPSQAVKSKAPALARNSKASTITKPTPVVCTIAKKPTTSNKSTAPTTTTTVGAKAKATTPAKPLKGRTTSVVPPVKAVAAPKVAAVKPRASSTPMVLRNRSSIANAPKTTPAPKVVKAVGATTAPKPVKAAPKTTVAPKVVKAIGATTAPRTPKATPKPVRATTAAATPVPRTTEARKGLKTAIKHSLPAPASKKANHVEWTPARKVKVITAEDCGCKFSTPMRDNKRRTSPIWLRGSGTVALTTVQEDPLSLQDVSFDPEMLMEDQDQEYLEFKTGATKQTRKSLLASVK